jgi:hypothetical protein
MRVLTTGVQRLIMVKRRIEKLQFNEQNARKLKRQQYRVLVEVDLTLEKVLEDFFHAYRMQFCQNPEDPDQVQWITQTLWIPDTISPIDPWEREAIEAHLQLLQDSTYLEQIPAAERELTEYWSQVAEESCQRQEILSMLEAVGWEDLETFKQEVLLRLAQQHKLIVAQNLQVIFDQVGRQITRMLRIGSITPSLLINERYGDFQLHVLPYIYYFGTKDTLNNDIWVRSPYPFSKLIFLIRLLEQPLFESSVDIRGDQVDLALTLELLRGLLAAEQTLLASDRVPLDEPTRPEDTSMLMILTSPDSILPSEA